MYLSLQAGRAFAAILVVLFHLGGAIAAERYFGLTAFAIPFSFGAAGVEFFFVLSGFIILSAHHRDIFNPDKLTQYIWKRLTRIYPTYWIIFLGVYFLAISSAALRDTVPNDIYTVLKSMLLIPQDKSTVGGTGAPVIAVAWTLQYEMFFYFFFCFLILNRWLSLMSAIILMYFYISYSGKPSPSFIIAFLSKDYILLFAMGMIVSAICLSKKLIVRNPMIYTGMGAVIFLSTALDIVLETELLTEKTTIIYGVASSLIIFGLAQSEDKGHVLGDNRWVQLLGDSSYALYLMHYPIIVTLCKLFLFLRMDKLGIMGALVSYFSILFVCIMSSIAFHLCIEKPLAQRLRVQPPR